MPQSAKTETSALLDILVQSIIPAIEKHGVSRIVYVAQSLRKGILRNVGFPNASHFATRFSRIVGASPGEFQQRNAQQKTRATHLVLMQWQSFKRFLGGPKSLEARSVGARRPIEVNADMRVFGDGLKAMHFSRATLRATR